MKYKMTKIQLQNKLKEIQLNYQIGFAGLTALNCNDASKILNSSMVNIGAQQYNFDEIIKIFSNRRSAEAASNSYYAMLLRSTVKEAFEMIKTYCEHQRKDIGFKNQPFYQIAKLARDTLSHSMIINIRKDNEYNFPYAWQDITINNKNEINNKKLEDIGFTYYHAFLLLEEFADFLKFI